MDVLDGRRPRPAELAVDAGDEELDLSRCARYSGLSSRDGTTTWIIVVVRARPGSCSREALERLELLRNALRVVEAFDPEHELAALVLFLEIGEETPRLGIGDHLAEAIHVDPDRIDADADPPSVDSSQSGSESIPSMRRHDERK